MESMEVYFRKDSLCVIEEVLVPIVKYRRNSRGDFVDYTNVSN